MAATYGGAYRAFGIDPPSVYLTACNILADAFIEAPPYSRPATKPTGHAGDNAFRGTFVREEDGVKRGQMVREHEDKEKHMREAANARPPSRVERAGYACRPDTVAAILQCAKLGARLAGWREQQTQTLNKVRKMLEPLNETLRKAQPSPPNVHAVAGDVNLAMLCALVDALDWPDKLLPLNFAKGFPSVGHIPDSGVYRPIEPVLSEEEFQEAYQSIDSSNEAWLEEVCEMMQRRAKSAKPAERDAMRVLKAKTMAEEQQGFCSKLMNKRQLQGKYKDKNGRLRARVVPRFGVPQGRPGAQKVRAIDDGKLSRTNEMQRVLETITTPSPDFPAHVLDELIRACLNMGMAIPDLVLSLDDLLAAYRRVPTAHQEFMVAAMWDPDAKEPVFCEVYGHCFGLVSSVLNFNRVPHMLSVAASLLFAAPNDHYFDDYLVVDLASAKGSAQKALDELHKAVRIPLEPKKRKPPRAKQEALGVNCDLSQAAAGRVVMLSPTRERVDDILADLKRCRASNYMPPWEAEALFGRLGFVLRTTGGAVGRAATQPLLQRSREQSPQPFPFTLAMHHMLNFFEALLPNVQPLTLPCGQKRCDADAPVVVYTDASYNENGFSGLGIVILDGDNRYTAGCKVPEWLLAWLRPRGQQINHLEMVAAVAARTTFPDVLAGREVIHFVDNTTALSKAVHGYANEPDMANLVNSLHICDAMLAIDAWWEWVPSKANVADLPSRDPSTWDEAARHVMAKINSRMDEQGFGRRELRLPTTAQLSVPAEMMHGARTLAAAVVTGPSPF